MAMSHILQPGEPAPWFHVPALDGNSNYAFSSAAGRPILMLFLGSAATPEGPGALALLARHRALFDDHRACFFGVSVDPADAAERRIAQLLPGIRWFLDHDGTVSHRFGAMGGTGTGTHPYRQHWLLLDPAMRVLAVAPIGEGEAMLRRLSALIESGIEELPAPVLVAPRILEPELCARLIALYRAQGGEESGFMREEAGMTVLRVDPEHKRRADHLIEDATLIDALRVRLRDRLKPLIARAFQFEATRIERWLVACYDGEGDGGHFRPHRDNTTKGTAHRRFACTINLNAGDYEGGDLRFPEYGTRLYRAPTGGAVVFSCSLLHEATPVKRGQRYAFLPFFYDDAAARLRERNLTHVAPELKAYRSGLSDRPEEKTGA
jgi:predicted 2-oxoglutarate/Fe(II)-dependent dioxygenase YbiX/peroxiredoxin